MGQHAWSYSALTAFEQCPRRFYLTRVTKSVPDPMGDAALWGNTVHKHLQDRAEKNTPLPDPLRHLEPLVAKIVSAPGETLVEYKMTLTSDFQPTSWFAKDAWVRSVVDVGKVNANKAVLFDYKTGKYKPDNDQLDLFAAVMFSAMPQLDTIQTGFLWVGTNDKPTTAKFTRGQAPAIWETFLGRVARMEEAHSSDRWPPKPSGLCKRYCPVPNKVCPYSGRD